MIRSLSDLTFLEKNKILGEGAFSRVHKVQSKLDREVYALKIIDLFSVSQMDIKNLNQEIVLHKELQHPHIIRFLSHFQRKNMLYLILEYAGNGSLFFFIHSAEGIKQNLALRFFYQTAKAVQYLHSKNLIHRDIKPENILLDEQFNVKLCDFGWSCMVRESECRTSICGTYEYMSPEIAFHKTHTNKVDIWCLGVLLFEMFHGLPPFSASTLNDIKDEFLRKKIEVRQSLDPEIKDLIHQMLVFDESKRITIDQVLQHPLLQKNLDYFNQPLSQEDFSILFRNYLLNTQGVMNKTQPHLLDQFVHKVNPLQTLDFQPALQ